MPAMLISYKSLPLPARRSILWQLFLRWLAVSVASAFFGGVAGFVIAFGVYFGGQFFGDTVAALRPLATLCAAIGGLLVGLWFLYVLFRWVLRCQLGPYAIRLVALDSSIPTP